MVACLVQFDFTDSFEWLDKSKHDFHLLEVVLVMVSSYLCCSMGANGW
jgi:hypothetical protein